MCSITHQNTSFRETQTTRLQLAYLQWSSVIIHYCCNLFLNEEL